MPKNNTKPAAKKKARKKSRKPRKSTGVKLTSEQRKRMRQIETDAATNLSATINAMEELTESSFIRTAINNAVAEQCARYDLPGVKHGDETFSSTLETILKFGPVVDDIRAAEPEPLSFERINDEGLIAVANSIGARLYDDREAVLLFCGLLEYFAKMSKSDKANYLDDDTYAVAQRMFQLSLHGDDASDKFIAEAYASLGDNVKALTAPPATEGDNSDGK